jgi:hypothetical protein
MVKRQIGKLLEKIGLKKRALRIYFFIYNNLGYFFNACRKRVVQLKIYYRSRKGTYAIDLDTDWLGLGARIVKTLQILLYCEEKGLTPLIRYNYQQRDKSVKDYFGELFEYKQTDKNTISAARFTSIRDIDELGWPEDYNKKLKLDFAKSLFDRHFLIQTEITAEVEDFCKGNFKGQKILGVHYRGTDKAGEAPLVPKEKLLERIMATLNDNPRLEMIFLSSDDGKIIHFIQNADLHVPIVVREDAVRSADGDQFHRKVEISKTIVNRDAIVNMLILARCSYLLKTASILSDCSVIFNPTIEVEVISQPHHETLTWWPCTEILDSQKRTDEKIYS